MHKNSNTEQRHTVVRQEGAKDHPRAPSFQDVDGELLEIVKRALTTFERDFPNGQLVIDMRAAIAKAEGK